MLVLITRPVRDCEPFRTRVQALGCDVMLAPLMEIVFEDIPAGAIDGASGIVATSRNALAALAPSGARSAATGLPLYVVGPGTAKMAREMGFSHVVQGPGRAEDLVPVLAANGAAGRRLIYLRGDVLAFDLEAALAARGIDVVPIKAYRSVAAESLPSDVIEALNEGRVDAVTLLSPRAARIWAHLIGALQPPLQLSGLTYLCLSDRVREALGSRAKADKVLVSSQPNVEDMLALIKRLAASPKAE